MDGSESAREAISLLFPEAQPGGQMRLTRAEWDLVKELRARKGEGPLTKGYETGAVDFIFKPIDPEILRSKVKVFVELHQMQQRTRQIAEHEAARALAEEAKRRANFLAHASQELGASLDLEQGMRRLLDLVVPHVCDVAALTVEAHANRESRSTL